MKDPRIRLKWRQTWPGEKSDDYVVNVPTLDLPYMGWDVKRDPECMIARIYPQGFNGFMAGKWHWYAKTGDGAQGWADTAADAASAAETAFFKWWGDRKVPDHWLRASKLPDEYRDTV